jgi:hypothetical protein
MVVELMSQKLDVRMKLKMAVELWQMVWLPMMIRNEKSGMSEEGTLTVPTWMMLMMLLMMMLMLLMMVDAWF